MQILVKCPACEASFDVPTALVGRGGECSQCRNVFRVTPLSGEVDPEILNGTSSDATLTMPIVNEDGPAGDTDEFDIPDVPGARSESSKADMPAPSQAETPELKVPELDIPDLDVPAAPSSISPKKESAAHPSEQDVTFEEAPGEVPPPVLIEDDGSLFGDEIPELEEVREPVSRYASEDEVDPDAGGSYSLSGSAPAPRKRKAKKARRKKATIKKTARRRRNQPNAAEGDSSATPDHDSEVDEVQLFDDVLHDDEEDDAGPGASPVMLRRSGTFSTPGKSPGKSGGKAADPVSHTGGKLAKRRPAAREGKSDSNAEGVSRKPVLKRRSSEDRPAASRPKSRPRKKSQPMSPESQRKLMMIGGGGAGLLILIGLFSYLTSGPAVITPTVQSGAANPSSTQSSGPTPVPNQNGDTIQTGDTNSSVARENRIRGAASTPRRIEDPPGGSKIDTGESTVVESGAAETTEPGGTTSSGNETPDSSLPDGSAVVARPLTAPAGPQVALVTEPGSNATSAANGHFQTDDDKLFPVETVPIPAFPNLGTPRASTISGVVFHEIAVGGSARIRKRDEEPLPGSQMDMILYLPSGAHELGSLPCVMIAAAGTTMLEGNGCYDESYQSETIPYVQEGFAVLGYSLDGPLASDKPSKLEKKSAYEQFRAAHAGLVNARNAMEFLVQKVPAINSDRIFTAGHSSAGMLSLLFAEHESRLAGCIAYAPCVDVEKRLSDYISNPLVEVLLPEVDQFVRQGSPQRHFQSLKCPVFLFHAEGDADAPFAESREFAERLAALGTPCHLESVPDGDHYKSMLEEGIPRGIVWLKNTALGESSDSDQPSDPESKNPAIDDPKPSD